MKTCTKCLYEFEHPDKYFYSDNSKIDGLYSSCKACSDIAHASYNDTDVGRLSKRRACAKHKKTDRAKELDRIAKRKPERKVVLREIERRNRYKKLYGITVDRYEEMAMEQNGLCLICGKQPKENRLCVDHCHTSGDVRGLLCHPCNLALGRFEKYQEQFNNYMKGR